MSARIRQRDSFVATKLIPPGREARGVDRQVLANGADTRSPSLVAVIGTAGSGKSTLLTQLHEARVAAGWATAWVSLDADDNNPAAFAGYLIAALEHIDPSIADRGLAAQHDYPIAAFDDLFARLEAYITSLIGPAAIFLDDFHHVTDDRIIGFLNRLIQHLPEDLQLVVASRHRLPLALGRARMNGSLLEIEQDDLNFDPAEAAELFRTVHGLALDPTDFDALLGATEGWAAGLQLAAIALRRHRGAPGLLIRQFSGRDQDLAVYLAESVLASQPDEVRKFLLRTAPLRRMCVSLCEAATGYTRAGEMLAYLEQHRLFVVPLDRSGEWFRYHHLFSEFLQSQLRSDDPELYRSLCERAGAWCRQQGMLTESIQYLLDACRFEQAADLMADRSLALAQIDGDLYTILDWMRRLPEAYHARRPEIRLSQAWACAFARDTARALELAGQVVADLDAAPAPPPDERTQTLRYFARAIQAVAMAGSDDIEACLSRGRALLAEAPEQAGFILATAGNSISYSQLAHRDFEAAARTAAVAYHHGRRADSPYAMVWADFMHTVADIEQGRLTAAQETAARASASADSAGLMRGYSGSLSALLNAAIAAERGAFDEAGAHLVLGRSFAETFGPLEPLRLAFVTDARVQAWTRQPQEAFRILARGRDQALRAGYPRLFTQLAIEEVHLRLLDGEVENARRASIELELLGQPPRAMQVHYSRGLREPLKLLDARLALAVGDPDKALNMLSRQLYALGARAATTLLVTLRGLRAIALWQLDRQAEATRELDRAIVRAASDTCSYPLAACGDQIVPILQAVIAFRGKAQMSVENQRLVFETHLLRLFDAEPQHEPATVETTTVSMTETNPGETLLTFREVELLRLVEQGLPNKQLADALLISESTVKWHLHNINQKLEAANRTAAVARARELALI